MVRKLLAAVVPLTLLISPAAAQRTVTVAAQTIQQLYPSDSVRRIPDLVYSMTTSNRPLKLDLYLPPPTVRRPQQGFPLIVYLHGGGLEWWWEKRRPAIRRFPRSIVVAISQRIRCRIDRVSPQRRSQVPDARPRCESGNSLVAVPSV
jgi:hypothetical protein